MTSLFLSPRWSELLQQTNSNYLSHYAASTLFQAKTQSITLDYACQHMTPKTLHTLINLAEQASLRERIQAMFRGDHVNVSEQRPALHTALRAPKQAAFWQDHTERQHAVLSTRETMYTMAEQLRAQTWLGYSGKPITHIVNIGIGGSHLGALFCLSAFEELAAPHLTYHFLSEVDPNAFQKIAQRLDPETTLFIVVSKSFTTKETLYYARQALAWFDHDANLDPHFVAVTANVDQAHALGFNTVLPMWDWVGGRFSVFSSANFITAIALGREAFDNLLAGAYHMDQHFLNAPFEQNLPVLSALIGIWNINSLNIRHHLVLTYAQSLTHWVPYLQQLDMESNGKSMDHQDQRVPYATGPIIWGGSGNAAQHSYYQLICQGTHTLTADVISVNHHADHLIHQLCHDTLHVMKHGVPQPHTPNAYIRGNIAFNHLRMRDLTPFCAGELIALYEHKVFVQSVLWNINPFDQPGVESAKHAVAFKKERAQQQELA